MLADSYQPVACLGSMSHPRNFLVSAGSGVWLKMECVTSTRLWYPPFGPFGFGAWSMTLPISGMAWIAEIKILAALLVQEIWLVRKDLLFPGSPHPTQSSMQPSLNSFRT